MYLIMHAEIFQNNEWVKVGKCFKSALTEMEGQLTDRPCDERNYVLYEVLTGEHFKQNDSTWGIRYIEPMRVIYNEHRAYILNLNAILNYNWDKKINNTGVISEWQYKRLQNKGILPIRIRKYTPEKFNVVHPAEMEMILRDPSLRKKDNYNILYQYNERLIKDECAFFYNETIPALEKLVPIDGDMYDVRIVYYLSES